MNMGTIIFSGYLALSRQLTTVPLAAGNPAALSVTFHPSTRGAISSASFRNLRVGTNSFSIFIQVSSGHRRRMVGLKSLLHKHSELLLLLKVWLFAGCMWGQLLISDVFDTANNEKKEERHG